MGRQRTGRDLQAATAKGHALAVPGEESVRDWWRIKLNVDRPAERGNYERK